MLDFSRSELTHLALHHVGNKGLGEELTLSENLVSFPDDFVKETLFRYFIMPFKNDIYYQFKTKADLSLNSVANTSAVLFQTRIDFIEHSQQLAKMLYNQTMHPKTNDGEFYVCYFKDVVVDGELCDAIGLFKTETKQTFLKVDCNAAHSEVGCDTGINPQKLDKGCLIYNTDKTNGYKISIVDTNNKIAECALYWQEDFLNATLKTTPYYHTSNFIDTARGFCEEILTEANNVTKTDQKRILNESVSFFKDKSNFNISEFEKEVLKSPDVIESFRDYRQDFSKRMAITTADDFDVSATALKKNQKYMRSIVKLDHNFHIYIHSRHDYIEKGFDEEKGLKFYKLYFTNED